jgi:hypothetical protein
MSREYLLPDEPQPQGLERFAVNPAFALFASMLAGQWLAWPWFIVNAIALGSPTRKREIAMVAIAAIGAVVISVALLVVDDAYDLPKWAVRLSLLALTTWKLAWAYAIETVQARTFQLYAYYGGKRRNALPLVLIGAFVLRPLVLGLFDSTLWTIVVAGGLD